MKTFVKALFVLAAFVMLFTAVACTADDGSIINAPIATPTDDLVTTDDSSGGVDDGNQGSLDTEPLAAFVMDYSAGIDEFGYWEGVVAKDCLEPFDYVGIEIPYETHTVSATALQAEIDYMLDSFKTITQVTDRAVAGGDTVNIDYVGSVDGAAFDGGSTGGAGTEVTIGVTLYIDDFLEQLIGHMPGETFDVNVTFPEDYGVEDLNGMDAVFVTTINYISVSVRPELTDEFAANNLSAFGWTTADEFIDTVTESLTSTAITSFLQRNIISRVTVRNIPDFVLQYQQDTLISYYTDYAAQYNMELDPFITSLLGLESVEALLEMSAPELENNATFLLAMQAIAEDLELTISETDLEEYFFELTGSSDYSTYEEQYGRPYLVQAVLSEKVGQYIRDNAVFLEE